MSETPKRTLGQIGLEIWTRPNNYGKNLSQLWEEIGQAIAEEATKNLQEEISKLREERNIAILYAAAYEKKCHCLVKEVRE